MYFVKHFVTLFKFYTIQLFKVIFMFVNRLSYYTMSEMSSGS